MRQAMALASLILAIISSTLSSAQERNCGTMEYFQQQLEADPGFRQRLERIERHTSSFLQSESERNGNTITIPVVFHIVYDVLSKNVSEAQIMSQLEVLNRDFRRLNTDRNNKWPQADDMEIEFCLAVVDPAGNPTNGITRTNSLRKNFPNNDDVKRTATGGRDGWPSDRYLNIWVCDIAGSVLGYAQFPGGPAATDGVVIDYQAFGTLGTAKAPFNLGRTATHEVGHWLNLRHIWGDGDCSADDFVEDTPNASGPNFKCFEGKISCGSEDMVANYMDYSDDACMNLFTKGQKSRMRALFAPGGFRHALLQARSCTQKLPDPEPATPYCSNISIRITLDNYPGETSWQLRDAAGKAILSGARYTSAMRLRTITADTCLTVGCYSFVILDSFGDGICCKYGNGRYEVIQDGKVIFSGGTFGKTEERPFCITAPDTCNDGIKNGTETGIDCGGHNCPPCSGSNNPGTGNTGSPGPQLLGAYYFESGWEGWTGGASDTKWYQGPYAFEGQGALMIMDDAGDGSAIVSPSLNLSAFGKVKIDFALYPFSMEKDEDFWLMYHDGTGWKVLKEYVSETDFENDLFYEASFTINAGDHNFPPNARFRFQCDASTNADQVYIDAVRITGFPHGTRISENETENYVTVSGLSSNRQKPVDAAYVHIHPNPASGFIHIDTDLEDAEVEFINMAGKTEVRWNMHNEGKTADISWLPSGIYLLKIISGKASYTRKLMIAR